MKKRNLFILSISSLVLLIASSLAMSFAWYVEGADLFVNYVSIEFAGEKSLLISNSPEESSFRESLNKSDLKQVDTFKPITSAESNTWISNKSEKPEFLIGYSNKGDNPKSIKAIDGYFSQELYLFSEDDIYATISKSDFKFLPNSSKNAQTASTLIGKYPNLTVDQIAENLDNIYKSLRVSILIPDNELYSYYIFDPFKNSETYLGGIMDSNADGYYDNFDNIDSSTYETVYGDIQNRDKLVYDPAPNTDQKATGLLTCFNANRRKGVKQFNLEKSIENGVVIPTEDSLSLDEVESKLQIPIDSYEPRKIVLSIYLEGWDLDNTNLVSYASFLIDIKFKISKVKEMS